MHCFSIPSEPYTKVHVAGDNLFQKNRICQTQLIGAGNPQKMALKWTGLQLQKHQAFAKSLYVVDVKLRKDAKEDVNAKKRL